LQAVVGWKKMKDWCHTFAEELWLKPDDVGDEEAAFIKKALRLRKGSKVLDAPCGAGRVAVHLARAGCEVVGIDLRSSFTDRARERFRHEGLKGGFIPMDLRKMDFESEFYGIYSWLGSFGYFPDTQNFDVMRRYAKALRKGGRLLVEQPNREALLRHFIPCCKTNTFIARNKWNRSTERLDSDWIVEKNGNKQHNRMSIRLYTPTQMCALFKEAGLTIETLYGSKNGEPYVRSSKRLIVVGKKTK
jgi:cyclopropane fatty-acyl-phospholipid synthase-like methyltransferase